MILFVFLKIEIKSSNRDRKGLFRFKEKCFLVG